MLEFSQILHNAAYRKDRIVVTKNGKDIAAVVPIEDLRLIEEIEDRADLREARRRVAHSQSASVCRI
ncbi:MAG TPA: type II toxin-antitoxin system prevent-host-death family antitoxin [Terriglobia bacterium]|nr:type II toxin-antitoxin system prevent-host-death family antitoxin [Terriglobia bacterium]